ncbi:pilus assembly protein PilX [Geomesophilobacter sediminis]|uniref:Pilus assembly protein PilX n=1 Tax=Geomesophilobacter sediminis TaxID=2798584 RepID=A0A8J7M2C4_9BACT|nr:pilus assembly protein PilX [Geomesophilobacter sediminis]MBJ6727440.1 pilus assembly protein PilX [Geomesophilobacter sediminis]
MKALKNEKGIALVTSLMLTLISLGIIMALLYMISAQTKVSGAHKRYKNSLEASHGGVQLLAKELIPLMITSADPKTTLTSQYAGLSLNMVSNPCITQKLTQPSGTWSAVCGANSTNADPKVSPDVTFTLPAKSGPGYKVYAKIVDTTPGNSDTSGLDLDSGAAVTGGVGSGISPKHLPALYRIETEGESASNPQEKAALTVLYAY